MLLDFVNKIWGCPRVLWDRLVAITPQKTIKDPCGFHWNSRKQVEDVYCQSWTAGSFKNVDLQAAPFAQLLCFCSVHLECYWSDFCYFSRKEAWNCFFFESTNQPKQLVSSPVILLSASDQNPYHLTTCWYWDTCLAKGQGSRRLSKSNHSSGGSTYSWTADGCRRLPRCSQKSEHPPVEGGW